MLGYKTKDAKETYDLLVGLGFRKWFDNQPHEPSVDRILEIIKNGTSYFVLDPTSRERFYYCCSKSSPYSFRNAYMVDTLEEFLQNHPEKLEKYIRSSTKLGQLL